MINKNWIIIIVSILLLVAVHFSGWLTKPEKKCPELTSHTVIQYLPAPVVNDSRAHTYPVSAIQPIALPNDSASQATHLLFPEFTFKDSIEGRKDSVGYKVVHTATFLKDLVKSVFDVEIKPYYKQVIDSIYVNTVTEITKPYYKDIYFYTTVIEGIVIVAILIKSLWLLLAK